jgi:predicted RNA-binding protein Jag
MDQEYQDLLQKLIISITTPLIKEEVKLNFLKEGDQWRVNLTTAKESELIGEHKEILNSIQHITRVAMSKKFPGDRTHFILDINRFRLNREEFLNKTLMSLADSYVLKGGQTLILLHLSSYERRLIHQMMTEVSGLETISVGSGHDRRLIIRPTSDTGSIGMDKAKVIDVNKEINDYLDKSQVIG